MSIADYFRPQQRSIDFKTRKNVSYREITPSPDFREYIYCYWRLHSTVKLDYPFMYRVVSDGCIDILFETSQMDRVFITGFSTRFIEFDLGTDFNYVGVRFLPTGFPILFNLAASKFTNEFLDLSPFLPELTDSFKQIGSHELSLEHFKAAFDSIFKELIQTGIPVAPDPRVLNAMEEILSARGDVDIQSLDTGLSERQLRRLFKFYYGESPKTFCQIVRFQNILQSKPSMQSLKQNKIFYNLGYYDQAHFIKEFKNFYGVTPSQAFGREA